MIKIIFKVSFLLLTSCFFFLSFNLFSEEIEEIVVKGKIKEVNLNKSNTSLVILEKSLIDEEPIKHFEQLSFLVPNLNFSGSDSRARYFQIRGIGERSGYEGTPNSSVGFIIDDIDFSGLGGIANTFDVEQIEVHRGPQGSRMGANSLAGLIYIKTIDPSDLFESRTEINIGSDKIKNIGLAFGGPLNLNKKLKYRVALRKDNMDGFRNNLYLNRSDTSRKDEFSGRIKITWDINEKNSINFLAMNVDLNDPADVWNLDGSLDTLSDKPGMDSQNTKAYGLKLKHLNKKFDIQSLSSHSKSDIVFSYDADWGNPISHAPYIYDFFSETLRLRETLNQEIRIFSKKADFSRNNRSEWAAGIYYLKTKERNLRKDEGIYEDPFSGYDPYVVDTSSSSYYTSKNLALFANYEYFLTKETKITTSLRKEEWSSNYHDSFGEKFKPRDYMTGGKVSLSSEFKNGHNSYISVGRGYKSGGFNLGLGLISNEENPNLIYEPEYLINYEFGLNLRYPNYNLYADATFFYSDRKNQQVLISKQIDPNDPNAFTFLTQNAAKGINYGMELSLKTFVKDNLYFFYNLGLLKTEITEYDSRPELEGRDQAHAPKNSYSLGVKWRPTKNTYLNANIVGKDSFYYSDSHSNKSKSYYLTNILFGVERGKLRYEFWIKNLFDRYYAVRGFYFGNEPPNFPDTLYERQGDPRHLGIQINYEL